MWNYQTCLDYANSSSRQNGFVMVIRMITNEGVGMNEYITALIEQQRIFFTQGASHDIGFRMLQLIRLKEAIISHEEEIITALHTDLNKPRFEAYTTEIYPLISSINHALDCLKSWSKTIKVKTPLIFWPARNYISYEPYGLTLIIAPWNYPFHLSLEPLIGAIAAGNCATIKPSEFAMASAAVMDKIIKAAFPSAYITVVTGDAQTAQELLTYRFDYIFFTGSSAVGKKVMHIAADHLTPLTLELGGKSPCIISQYACLESAAKKVVWAKFLNAGQSCIAPDYLLVDAAIKEKFITLLKKHIVHFFGNEPAHSADYGRIINQRHIERLKNLMQHGVIRHGGTIRENERYIAPTIIDQINLNDPIMQEEIFGPLLPIISYTHFRNALDIVRKQPKPLAVYLFTNNRELQRNTRLQTSSGSLCINEVMLQAASANLPFGGVGASGFGRYHGKKSFETFSNIKTIMKGSSFFTLPLRYPPYGRVQRWLQKWLQYYTRI